MRLARAAALGLLLLFPLLSSAAPRIGVVTMQPGTEYWARFGHNAILVESSDGDRLLYNYGFFDFEQDGFLTRFLRGRMLYQLAVLPYAHDMAYYDQEGRGVRLQWLRLEPAQAGGLAEFLQWNARPENAAYRYDYFLDNCATRVRDALDQALGGSLKSQLIGRSRGLTYRSESQRLSAPVPWLYLGIDLGLGPRADRVMSRWDEGFVPMRLAEALREARATDGGPLIEAELELLPHRLAPALEEPPQLRYWFLAAGALLALAFWRLGGAQQARARNALVLVAGGFWLVGAIGGSLLLGLWLFTDHLAAHANANLLLLNPLCFALLGALPALRRGRVPPASLRWLALAIAIAGTALLLGSSTRLLTQSSMDWLLLVLPSHWVLWRACSMPQRTSPESN